MDLLYRTRDAFPQSHTAILQNLGRTYQDQFSHYSTNPDKQLIALQNAYITFEQAIDSVEYLRGKIVSGDEAKRKLNERWNRLYLGIVKVCLKLKKYTTAIEYVDRSKARNLVELIATRDAYPQGEIPSETRQRLQDLRQAIDQENRRLEQEEEKSRKYTHINQLREEFQEKYPYKPLTFDDIQNLLDEETAILEWYILDDKFLTFTLTAQTLDLWTSSSEDLKKLIDWTNAYLNVYNASKLEVSKAKAQKLPKKWQDSLFQNLENLSEIFHCSKAEIQKLLRKAWQNSLPQRFENLSEILHLNDLLNTLFTKFPTCKKLILIPHRYLHLFPIHALPITKSKNLEGANITPLQEIFAKGVSYAPNCQLLQQAQNRLRHDFNRLFAISNPTEDLIFADLEVETIRESFPKDQRATLRGNKATKTTFLAKDFTQTHNLYFSCHGAFSPNSPLDSGLQLADDVLTLTEIIGSLNLSQCRLVTLSACETGITDFTSTSDEYIGLTSGFLLAGSPNVVSSLWAVNDLSTALLMIRFYQNLNNGETVPLALQHAQKWLRDATVGSILDWSKMLPQTSQQEIQEHFELYNEGEKPFTSPYHWAAFCAIGQ